MKSYRHGDWTFESVSSIPKEAKKVRGKKDFTFGEGEATGHFHVLHADKIDEMEWYKMPDGSWYVTTTKETHATHPEHSMKVDLKVAPGTYHVRQLREKDWFSLSVRRVID